jgi:MFS family permease
VTLSPARSPRGPEPGSGAGPGEPAEVRGPVPGARRALVLLAVFSIVSFGDKAVLGLAGPRMIEDLGLTNAQFGLIGSSFYLLFSISAFVTGLLNGRLQATWLLAGMAVVWSAAQLPVLLPAAGLTVLVATRVLLGAGEGPGLPMANHVAFTWFRPEQRTTASGVISMGGALGVIIGGPLLAGVIAAFGWRWAFGLLGVVGLVWVAVWLAVGGEGPYAVDEDDGDTGDTGDTGRDGGPGEPGVFGTPGGPVAKPLPLRRIVARPTFLLCVVAGFAAQWTLGLATAWLPTFLEHEAGYSTAEVGFLVAVPSLVAIAAVLGVVGGQRRLRAREVSRRGTYRLLGLLASLPPGLLLIGITSGVEGVPLLLCIAVAFGSGVAVGPLVAAALADVVPVASRGLTLCVAMALTSLGAVASPWVTGRLLDLAATEAAGFDVAFRLNGALVLAGGLLLLLVDPDRDNARLRRPASSHDRADGRAP